MNTHPVRWLITLATTATLIAGCGHSEPEYGRPDTASEATMGDSVPVGSLMVKVVKVSQRATFQVHGNDPVVPRGVFEVVSLDVRNPDGQEHPWPSNLSKLLAAASPMADTQTWVKYPANKQVAALLDPGPEGAPIAPGGQISTVLVFDVPKEMAVFGVVLQDNLWSQTRTVLFPRS